MNDLFIDHCVTRKEIRSIMLRRDLENDLSLQSHTCVLICQTANKVSRLYGSLLAEHGLTFSQYQVIVVLWEQGPSTVGSICAALALDTSTVTPVLKRLQSLGYVDRFRDRVDERRVIVSLTQHGQAFKADASTLRCRLATEFGTTEAESGNLQHSLRKISSTVDRMLGQG